MYNNEEEWAASGKVLSSQARRFLSSLGMSIGDGFVHSYVSIFQFFLPDRKSAYVINDLSTQYISMGRLKCNLADLLLQYRLLYYSVFLMISQIESNQILPSRAFNRRL